MSGNSVCKILKKKSRKYYMRILKASVETSPETFSLIHFMQLVPFIPPENIRNPPVFCFQGVEKETSSMK